MRATIVVQPERLRLAAATVRALGDRVAEVRGQLGPRIAGIEAGLGDGRASRAFDDLWARWSASAERLAASVAALAADLQAAADAYERTERSLQDGEGSDAAAR
jgi:WXG100 family type VII secretion target